MYRLDVVSIVLPPLRDRAEDVAELAGHFLEQARARYTESPVQRLSPAALAVLGRYRWPGNVRELHHTIEKVTLLAPHPEVAADDLPEAVRRAEPAAGLAFTGEIIPLRDLERRYAAWALAQTGGHRGKTAEKLGVDPKTLRKWLGEADRDGHD